MRSYLMAVVVSIVLWGSVPALAQTAPDPDTALQELLKTMSAPAATDQPRLLRTPEGYIRFIGAPAGGRFVTQAAAAKSSSAPDTVAKDFVSRHTGAFGLGSAKQGFDTERITSLGETRYVRLQQTYSGFTVFGAQMLVQLDGGSAVQCVSSDIMRDGSKLDSGEVPLTPTITMAAAESQAKGHVAGLYGVDVATLTTSDAERMVLDPRVVGKLGDVCVVFELKVFSQADEPVAEHVFVNVATGEIAFHYPLIHDARNRRVYDGGNMMPLLNTLLRSEGDPPTGIADADNVYDSFGDTYDFYYATHGRDSIDGAGMPLRGTINTCYYGCPMYNAFWVDDADWMEYYGFVSNSMYFGQGYTADDVVGHELTHGVTTFSSNLIYAYQSGAINESFSDIWGEFIDLTNGRGDDSESARWWHGEDLPEGPNRNMQDPTIFGDPDRVGSDYYYNGYDDNGGVHWNSGVINKLCYLLTDGDQFNGYAIEGQGIERTAKLFYECQANILTEASDFEDLYMALGQASSNLDYSIDEQMNVRAAARAVEIAPLWLEEDLRLFRAVPAYTTRNRPVIALYWDLPNNPALRQVILVRSTGTYARTMAEGFEIYRGLNDKFLDDTGITAGVTYYYSLFADVTEGFPSAVYANATAGTQPANFLTEEFLDFPYPGYTLNPFDLRFSQITFAPTGAPSASLGSTAATGDYSNYTVTVRRNVYEFPVPRGEADEAAYEIFASEDGGVWCGLDKPFPFFQKEYTQIYLAANGYISFEYVPSWYDINFPSYAAHFAVPRISFMFADLAPKIGGEIWAKYLDDRVVATFESVPQWNNFVYPPSSSPNSVQVELFYSGHIRMTYIEANMEYGVVGLSDGRGAPRNPADLFENLKPVEFVTDFSDFSYTPTALSIEPIVPPVVEAGQVVEFTARATGPAQLGMPSLWAEWDREGFPTFFDEGNGTGHFRWETAMDDYGVYTVRVYARLGDQLAYQDVRVWVEVTEPLPSATDLGIRTNNIIEDPTRNRIVSDDTELIAEYIYHHPLQYILPEYYEEGATQILWFQNQRLHYPSNNVPIVPPNYTKPNDQWFFQVLPETAYGEQGMHATSPVVTVLALPEILDVILLEDLPEGQILPEDLPLPGVPVAWGPSSGGTEVAILGRKLSNVVSVKIGGIECASIHSLSDNRMDVIAPAHVASPMANGMSVPETIVVTTSAGTSAMPEAFVYLASATAISKADVNRDGVVDAVDVQLVINAVLNATKSSVDADVNRDGKINSVDIQAVINEALRV